MSHKWLVPKKCRINWRPISIQQFRFKLWRPVGNNSGFSMGTHSTPICSISSPIYIFHHISPSLCATQDRSAAQSIPPSENASPQSVFSLSRDRPHPSSHLPIFFLFGHPRPPMSMCPEISFVLWNSYYTFIMEWCIGSATYSTFPSDSEKAWLARLCAFL